MIVHAALQSILLALPVLSSPLPIGPQAGTPPAQEDADEQAPVFMGLAFILEVDLDAGRRAGTLAAETTDEQALEQIATALRARLVGSGKFVEGQVALEPENRVAVTFVGQMGEAYNTLLKAGLSNSGRLVCYAKAEEASTSADLTAERTRLDTWRTANPERDLREFDSIPAAEGGPTAGLVWRLDQAGEPLPLLAETARLFTRADVDQNGGDFRLIHDEQGPVGFLYTVGEESLPIVSAYWRARTGKQLYFVVNGRVHAPFAPGEDWDGIIKVSQGFNLEQLRGFLFAFSGEPFPAPVRFVEFGKRQLLNVKLGGEDPEVIRVPYPGDQPK